MAKKKNKDVDFKKTKLKVGKVRKSGNLTKPTFKASKVTLKEASDLRVDPVKSLSIYNANGGSSVKILKLNRLLEAEQLKQVHVLTSDFLNVLSRMIIDSDKRVRSLAMKCLKTALTTLQSSDVDVNPSITLILSHVRCALTHLDASIADDGRKFSLMLHQFSCVSSKQEQQEVCIKWCERQYIAREELFPTIIYNFSLDSSFKPEARRSSEWERKKV